MLDAIRLENARVVHQHVEAPELVDRDVDGLRPTSFVAHIVVHVPRDVADLGHHTFAQVVEDVGHDDARPRRREQMRFGFALATRAPPVISATLPSSRNSCSSSLTPAPPVHRAP